MIKLFKKIKKKMFGLTSEEYLEDIRKKGARIGHHVQIYDTNNIMVDCTRPYLLEIGDYTKITRGCIILTHDYSLSVLRRKYGEWIGEGGVTRIGENCFLGMNSIILMGTSIGNNCIIGAGSVVSGVFPDNVVIAGNPAKIIKRLDVHYLHRKEKTIAEAKECARRYFEIYGKLPKPRDLDGFKWLFAPRSKDALIDMNLYEFACTGDDPKEVEDTFFESKPVYDSFNDFLADAGLGGML